MRKRVLRAVALCVLVLAAALALDACRPPSRQASAALAIRAIHAYQRTVSPRLARLGVGCRFTPSCSNYAEAVLRKYGIAGGTLRAAWRVARCGPWTKAGTHDPPR